MSDPYRCNWFRNVLMLRREATMAVREKRKAENLMEGLENFSRPVISARSKDLSEMH